MGGPVGMDGAEGKTGVQSAIGIVEIRSRLSKLVQILQLVTFVVVFRFATRHIVVEISFICP